MDKPNLLSVPSRAGVLLAGTAGLISTMGTGNDGKTPEERETEDRAREASGNLAAALTLTAVGISLTLKKAHKAKKYKSIDVLTPEIVRLFIARIEIGERTKKYSRHSTQKIRIVYRDIGEWDTAAEAEEKPAQYSEIISESA